MTELPLSVLVPVRVTVAGCLPTRYTIHRRDGSTTSNEADGMWPMRIYLEFRRTELVILKSREPVVLRVGLDEVERVVRDDGEVWRPA